METYQINFDWGEKDREAAKDAWKKYSVLTDAQKYEIGAEMVNVVKNELEILILSILDDTLERAINKITIELRSNLGEVKVYEFSTVDEAVEFLNMAELKEVFIASDSLTLFEPPPVIDDVSQS